MRIYWLRLFAALGMCLGSANAIDTTVNQTFPVNAQGICVKDSAGKCNPIVLDANGNVPVSGAISVAAGANPCLSPSATLVSLGGATSAGPTTTQIVALSGTTKIYVCSLTVIGVSGTTPTFSLVQGTGSNCASNQGVLVPAWTTTAGALFAFANPVAVSTAAYALCWKTTGTSPVQNYQITYVQQ